MLIQGSRVVRNCFKCNAYYMGHDDYHRGECPYCGMSSGFFYSDDHFLKNITLYGIKLEDIKQKVVKDFVLQHFDFQDGKAIRKEIVMYTGMDETFDNALIYNSVLGLPPRLLIGSKEIIEQVLEIGKSSGKIKCDLRLITVKDAFEEIEQMFVLELKSLQEYKKLGGIK